MLTMLSQVSNGGRRQIVSRGGDEQIIGGYEGATQGVGEELATEIVDELGLGLGTQVTLQPVDARVFPAVGEDARGFDGTASQIGGTHFADGAIALEHEAEGIEFVVAARLDCLAVTGERGRRVSSPAGLVGGKHRTSGGGAGMRRPRSFVTTSSPLTDWFAGLVMLRHERSIGRMPPRDICWRSRAGTAVVRDGAVMPACGREWRSQCVLP